MEWEQEFVRLYTSADLNDVKKVFELKRKNIPPKLYRYRDVTPSVYRTEKAVGRTRRLLDPEKINSSLGVSVKSLRIPD